MKINARQFVDDYNRPSRGSDSRLGPRSRFGDCSASSRAAFSLVEMVVAVAIVAMLVAISLPAIKSMQGSNESTGALSMIEAAMSTARSLAISNNAYVGVRFQKRANSDSNIGDADAVPLDRDQYMILVIYDKEETNLNHGFRVIRGKKPIKLPVNTGVMDMMLDDAKISDDTDLTTDDDIIDTTTFTIVFSSNGKLTQRNVKIRNRDGKSEGADDTSKDGVINTEGRIQAGYGMFLQDGNEEMSRRSFVVYSRPEFKKAYEVGVPYSQYLKDLQDLETHYINPYTGTVINKD